jgi:hypothetical protein
MLTCASENWIINRSDRRKIGSAEIWFLRPVAGAAYTPLDQKRNTDIRSELKIFTSTERIERQQENWYERILRMRADSQRHY